MLCSQTPPVAHFFHPRLVHIHPQYEQPPGLVVADWRPPQLSWKQALVRLLLYKFRQASPSPKGMSKLPVELLDMIFRGLCGREVHAVRLVCTEWELASRPYFADLWLKQSLFWLTGAHLRRLERFARRFGPYMQDVHIATDHFTLPGLWRVKDNYVEYADYMNDLKDFGSGGRPDASRRRRHSFNEETTPLLGHVRQPLRDLDEPRGQYFRHAYQQDRPLSPWVHLHLWPFVWVMLCNTLSQAWMRLTGHDRRTLARIAKMMTMGKLVAVDASYASEGLNANEQRWGRASPGFAFELALLCGRGDVLADGQYGEHIKSIVAVAMRGRLLGED